MENYSLTLNIEINENFYIFFVGETYNQNNYKIIYKSEIPLQGIENNRISDLEKTYNVIKENVYLIEQKFNHTFKEVVIILENFQPSFLNFAGYKKLNGSQVLRENITYILNILKSCIDEIEKKKIILHIFNSKFYLDNKKIENLPIGLFGDFYSHELSCILINKNDFKNLRSIFDKCNLKIKKILIKSFIEGVNLSNNNRNTDTFFKIKINKNNSKIFFFEDNSLKVEQVFNFGTDIIMKDISKITSLKEHTIKKILKKIKFNKEIQEDDFIEKEFFSEDIYKKIKKKLIYQIAFARISEISELIIFKNINFKNYEKLSKLIFLELDDKLQNQSFNEIFKTVFSAKDTIDIKFLNNVDDESMFKSLQQLVHYGWKKEAIPVDGTKKSVITRFFETIFG